MRPRLLIVCCLLAITAAGADLTADTNALPKKYTHVTPLVSGPNDVHLARVVARILEKSQYLRKAFDDEVSRKFYDRYLDALDNLHMYFLQSDLQEFEGYRETLDDLTKSGDTTPARVIFSRFRERLDQQYDYVMELLKTEKFAFTGNDRYMLVRKDLPRPKDMTEAKALWRERLRYEYLQEKLNKEKPEEIVKIITRRYNRVLRLINDYDNEDALQIYFTALAHVYDPHSDYMAKSEFDNFSIGMRLSLYGIGALLRSEDGVCRIQSLTPGGPAENCKKLKPNDKIIAVAQSNQPPVDVVDMPLRKVVELIRGPKDSEVKLTIIPADAADPSARRTVSLIRAEVKLEDQAAKAKIYDVPVSGGQTMRLGVIDLPSFYSSMEMEGRRGGQPQKSTTTDVAQLIKKLTQENVAGIVLDLRRNGGGSLEEAINLTGLFINEGPVVQVKDTEGRVFVDNDPNDRYPGEYYKGPLVVLTSRFSASASEILAGALQDYDRALIVGDVSTHGKGTVQSLIQLSQFFRLSGILTTNDPGAVKITIRKFYRASGGSTQKKGVIPDLILPSVYNDAKIGEAALDNPLEWDEIEGAPHEKLNRVASFAAELKQRSGKRVATDRDFIYLQGEIERAKKIQEDKSVSLNEAQRIKEKQEADDRAKARKKELAARPEPPGKVYEILLKNVDEPGLPAPLTRTNSVKTAQAGDSGKNSGAADSATLKTNELVKATRPVGSGTPSGDALAQKGEDATDDTAAEDPTAAVDITLEETKRILLDLITLSTQAGALAGNATPTKK